MTTAKELYAKISGDLDRATRDSDSLKARFARVNSQISTAESELSLIALKLMPEAMKALPSKFGAVSAAIRDAEEASASSLKAEHEARERVSALTSEYEQARHELGVQADGERAAIRSSPKYREAEESAEAADAILKENAPKLADAEKQLARFTELARQSFMHRAILSAHYREQQQGHFLLSMWHSIGRTLRDTDWFRRMDADRKTAEQIVLQRSLVADKATMDAAKWKATVQQLGSEFEITLQPRRNALQQKAVELEQAQKAMKAAKPICLEAAKRLSDLQECRVEPARSARAGLASVLGREFGLVSNEDLEVIWSLANRPAAADLVRRATECSEELRIASAERRELMEQIDAIKATTDELDKVKRKMSRSGLNRSSKTIDNAETFMRSDMSGGFDLGTLTTISIVAEAVSDMGSSSSSDWSSSSSWSSSSFD